MKIAVLGGGVAGVTAAYFLGRDGHDVTLIDRADDFATMASSANAGFLAPNDAFAWASPQAPKQLVRSFLGAPTGLSLTPSMDLRLLTWTVRFMRECTPERTKANSISQLRLAKFSQEVQQDLDRELSLDYSLRRKGAFYLFRDPRELRAAARHRGFFEDYGIEQECLSMDELVQREPAMVRARDRFAGAIFGVTDASGDCEAFTRQLAAICVEKFCAKVLLGVTVSRFRREGDRIASALTNDGELEAEAFVLALGVGSAAVARTVGLRLPIYPVKGYSATFPIRDGAALPGRPGVEQTSLIAWSNMGDRFRMSSSAEIAGYDYSWNPRKFERIEQLAAELFQDGLALEKGAYRACLRPMTPGGPPIVGATRFSNLVLNTGHGHLGWTMACGTGRLVADLLANRTLPQAVANGVTTAYAGAAHTSRRFKS